MSNQSKPVYMKLRDMIAAAIIDGRYAEGEMLPSVRALAAEQGANPLTVAKAYQQFQNDGLVEPAPPVRTRTVPAGRMARDPGPDGPPRRLGARIAGRRLTAPAALAPAGRFASLRQPSSSATV